MKSILCIILFTLIGSTRLCADVLTDGMRRVEQAYEITNLEASGEYNIYAVYGYGAIPVQNIMRLAKDKQKEKGFSWMQFYACPKSRVDTAYKEGYPFKDRRTYTEVTGWQKRREPFQFKDMDMKRLVKAALEVWSLGEIPEDDPLIRVTDVLRIETVSDTAFVIKPVKVIYHYRDNTREEIPWKSGERPARTRGSKGGGMNHLPGTDNGYKWFYAAVSVFSLCVMAGIVLKRKLANLPRLGNRR